MLFNFKKVSKERKDQAQAWINSIKDWLNNNPLVEDWYLTLGSGYTGYGRTTQYDGDTKSTSFKIMTRKNGKLMDVYPNPFTSVEEIQEAIELAIENRSKNSTGSYTVGGPSDYYYHEVSMGKSHTNEWYESFNNVENFKLVKKLAKYINKHKIEVPSTRWFYFSNDQLIIKRSIDQYEKDFYNFINSVTHIVNVKTVI